MDEGQTKISLRHLGEAWLRVGVQSFGGGAVSLELIRREFTEKTAHFTNEEFAKLWALCQVTPGVNQLALAVAIGRELRGIPGIAVSLAGFLAPSVAITIFLAWGYEKIQGLKETQNALRAVIPATAGLGLATGLRMLWPLVNKAPIIITLLLGVTAVAAAIAGLPVFAVLIGGGFVGTATFLARKK